MKYLRCKKSFTLIELVMVIVIVGILAGASSMYIKETIDLWRFLSFRNEITAQGRMALERMSREIREIKLRTQSYEPIQSAQANSFRFIDVSNNDITFSLSGNNLLRTVGGVVNILASNVTSLQFCYYKIDNTSACTPACTPYCSLGCGVSGLCNVSSGNLSNVYRIVVKVDFNYGGQIKHLESQIYPRNLH